MNGKRSGMTESGKTRTSVSRSETATVGIALREMQWQKPNNELRRRMPLFSPTPNQD
jgi:hypothetical protein